MKTLLTTLALLAAVGSASAITQEEYRRISTGMSGAAVRDIAGSPDSAQSDWDTDDCKGGRKEIWIYRGEEGGIKGQNVTVTLCKGTVVRSTTLSR